MMKRLRLVSLWALCAAGCSSAAASTNDAGVGGNLPPGTGGIGVSAYQSGSRIKMKIYSTADGARRFVTWYDSLRGFDCGAYGYGADGKKRCVPSTGVSIGGYDGTYFSNASCTVMLGRSTGCVTVAPTMGALPQSYSCGGPTLGARIFNIGAEYLGTVYKPNGSSCVVYSPSTSAMERFWTVGAEIAPTEFAEVTETIE